MKEKQGGKEREQQRECITQTLREDRKNVWHKIEE